jgi:hypothetical protein
MHRKHASETHKAAICGPHVTRNTPVFQPRRISTRAKKRPFMELSSLFALFDRVARVKWFTRNDLTTGPLAQSANQNSTGMQYRHRPLRRAAERQPVPERIGDRHLALTAKNQQLSPS